MTEQQSSKPPLPALYWYHEFLAWAAHPAENGYVPVHPDTLRTVATILLEHHRCSVPPNALPLHGVPLDRPIWICSMCHGWNHVQDKHCTHTHAETKEAVNSADHNQRLGSPECWCGHRKASHDEAGCCGVCSCVKFGVSDETSEGQK